MIRAVLVLLLAGLFVPAAAADDKFTIKIKKDSKGDVLKATETDSEKGKSTFTIVGLPKTKDEESTSSARFKESILEKEPGKRATKFTRVYEKAEGAKNGKKLELSLIGKEVLITRDGMKVQYTVDGKALEGDNVTFLEMQSSSKGGSDKESQIDDLILPKQPVAVNDSWKLDMDAIAKDFAKEAPFAVDIAKSSGTGKLLKAYKKDGKQYGALEVEMNLAVTKLGMGEMAIDLDANSNVKAVFRFDGCIDGSSANGVLEMTMEMKMAGALKTNDMVIKVDINGTKKAARNQEDLAGKK